MRYLDDLQRACNTNLFCQVANLTEQEVNLIEKDVIQPDFGANLIHWDWKIAILHFPSNISQCGLCLQPNWKIVSHKHRRNGQELFC